MSVPTSYTSETLAAAMHAWLGPLAASLGWSAPTSYSEAITSALVLYGVSDLSQATDIAKLRALALYTAWQAAAAAVAAEVNWSRGIESVSSSHRHTAALQQVAAAKAAASEAGYLPVVKAEMRQHRITYVNDPYARRGRRS